MVHTVVATTPLVLTLQEVTVVNVPMVTMAMGKLVEVCTNSKKVVFNLIKKWTKFEAF